MATNKDMRFLAQSKSLTMYLEAIFVSCCFLFNKRFKARENVLVYRMGINMFF